MFLMYPTLRARSKLQISFQASPNDECKQATSRISFHFVILHEKKTEKFSSLAHLKPKPFGGIGKKFITFQCCHRSINSPCVCMCVCVIRLPNWMSKRRTRKKSSLGPASARANKERFLFAADSRAAAHNLCEDSKNVFRGCFEHLFLSSLFFRGEKGIGKAFLCLRQRFLLSFRCVIKHRIGD
jgi:hypothetical protein